MFEMKRKYILPIFSASLFVILAALSLIFPSPSFSKSKFSKVQIGKAVWQIEVAADSWSRAKGLSGRKLLAEKNGMLFVFNKPGFYSFWMRGMFFPLDLIWINNGKVVDITKNAPPAKLTKDLKSLKLYSPLEAAKMVLEINAGLIDKFNVKVGDRVLIY